MDYGVSRIFRQLSRSTLYNRINLRFICTILCFIPHLSKIKNYMNAKRQFVNLAKHG